MKPLNEIKKDIEEIINKKLAYCPEVKKADIYRVHRFRVEELKGELTNYITENYQPKTTSTDIELRKEFEELMYAKGMEGVIDTKFINLAWNFFAPHLSNKSELKKEAVEDFARYLRDNFKLDNLGLKGRWTKVDFLKFVVPYLSQLNKGDKE